MEDKWDGDSEDSKVVALAVKNSILQPQDELIREETFHTDGPIAVKPPRHSYVEEKEKMETVLHNANIVSHLLHSPGKKVQH